jgi:aspartyl-tRNA(Asn)/glutamyl-tRNA(Gln) amidotransferase subunit A
VLRESLARSDPRVAEKVSASLEALRAKGAQVVELSSPMLDYAVATYYLIETAEFASGMQKYDGIRYGAAWPAGADMAAAASVARGASLGLEIKRRILIGTFVSTKEHRDAWYTTALRAREKIRSEFARLFAQADVLATPAMPVPPWPVGERARPAEMYAADVLTVPANLAGVPAGVAPLGDGAGVMFTAPRFEESRVLAAMRAVEALQP